MEAERVETPAAAPAGPSAVVAAPPEPGLLVLARQVGNRAFGRMLQRHELDEPAVEEPTGHDEVIPLADSASGERDTDQKGISTPLPFDAAKDPLDGAYYVTRGGLTVEIKTDGHGAASTYTEWKWFFATDPSFTTAGSKVDSVQTPVVKAWIQTSYQSGVDKHGESAYGRGTTTDDKTAGNTSLRFHESCHGTDYLTYMANNPVPTLSLAVGDPAKGAQKKVDDYIAAIKKWHKKGLDDSEKATDAVGTPGKHVKP